MAEQGSLNFQKIIPERKVWTVAELTARLRKQIETAFPDVWVQGEISNARVSPNGHLYFTLKDKSAQISCFVWKRDARKLRAKPEDGIAVTVRGQVSVYEPRGQYQIVVNYLEPVGVGALQLAFEQLKKRLAAEGLFDEKRKRPLPMLPGKIGLVTSPRAAALQDIIRVLRRRFEGLHLLLYPVRVQGEGAAEEIAEAINFFSRTKSVDVVIVARGGGSIEDLWAFNEEIVARAIAACSVPIISGVGHQTDFTIADFAADLRAPTPSAAAELVVKSKQELVERLQSLEHKLAQQARYRVLMAKQSLTEMLSEPGWQRIDSLLRERVQEVEEFHQRIVQALREHITGHRQRLALAAQRLASVDFKGMAERRRLQLAQQQRELVTRMKLVALNLRKQLDSLATQLQQLSPQAVLDRGYAIVFDAEGRILKSAVAAGVGDAIEVQLAQGRLEASVKKVVKVKKLTDRKKKGS